MIKFILKLCKLALFITAVLVLGNVLTFEGKTVSDQVKIQIAQAERNPSVIQAKGWLEELYEDLKSKLGMDSSSHSQFSERLLKSEQDKLKSLLEELNSSHEE